jgi:hypothetical protein
VRGFAAAWGAFSGEVSIQVDGAAVSFTSHEQAVGLAKAALGYLAAADPAGIPVQARGECLLGLEQATAMLTAAHAAVFTAFTAARGHQADGAYSPACAYRLQRQRRPAGQS